MVLVTRARGRVREEATAEATGPYRLPAEVVARICSYLAADVHAGACAALHGDDKSATVVAEAEARVPVGVVARVTLLSLMQACRGTYAEAGRALYTHVELNADNFAAFAYGLEGNGNGDTGERADAEGLENQAEAPPRVSKTELLHHTRSVTLLGVPRTFDVPDTLPLPLWPNVRTLSFGNWWYEDLALWYDDPHKGWYGDDGARNRAVRRHKLGHPLERVLAALSPEGEYYAWRRKHSGYNEYQLQQRWEAHESGAASAWLRQLCTSPSWAGATVTLHACCAQSVPTFPARVLRISFSPAPCGEYTDPEDHIGWNLVDQRNALRAVVTSSTSPQTLEILNSVVGVEYWGSSAWYEKCMRAISASLRAYLLDVCQGLPARLKKGRVERWTEAQTVPQYYQYVHNMQYGTASALEEVRVLWGDDVAPCAVCGASLKMNPDADVPPRDVEVDWPDKDYAEQLASVITTNHGVQVLDMDKHLNRGRGADRFVEFGDREDQRG